jgi:hypothetical protein
MLASVAGAGLVISWLLVSTLGNNNDLALRAIIPAEIVLIIAAAAAAAGMLGRRRLVAATALAGLVLSFPDTATIVYNNSVGTKRPDDKIFGQSPEMWAAVRRYAAPDARVADNPLFLADIAPWPANLSWALLANRSSCFAGADLAVAFAPLSRERREVISAQFRRVFDGHAGPEDVGDLARRYGCDVVVVVPQDEAWERDPFADSPDYRLVETRDNRWRIYARRR